MGGGWYLAAIIGSGSKGSTSALTLNAAVERQEDTDYSFLCPVLSARTGAGK